MYGYTALLQILKGERLSSVFSPDGILISASAAPHCGAGNEVWKEAGNEVWKEAGNEVRKEAGNKVRKESERQ